MTVTVFAKNLSLGEVHQRFGFERSYGDRFDSVLTLEPLTEFELAEVAQIREDFDRYLVGDRVSEGMVKLLSLFPLLRLAGFYRYPIELKLEENIAPIQVKDEDAIVTGRLDALAVVSAQENSEAIPFWALLVEAKNSEISAMAGLPQLLTYAFEPLQQQGQMWGLVTNGLDYLFVWMEAGEGLRYRLMPQLHFMDAGPGQEVLRVLKAIRGLVA